ncbi:EspA/EspE family type VII secretion system effector [Mycobacterium sp. 050134]|uniref:EspA/EspE family type VII secretion system effector n=1 Tax=Mycobacterium sp. 050134 TaxID=3096111 RepID=UPI002EDA771F
MPVSTLATAAAVFQQGARILASIAGLGANMSGLGLDANSFANGVATNPESLSAELTSNIGDWESLVFNVSATPIIRKYFKGQKARDRLGNRLYRGRNAVARGIQDRLDGQIQVRESPPPKGKDLKTELKKGLKGYKRSLSIILWTIAVVESLELTTGLGQPYEGDDLESGSQQFGALAAQLKSALADDGWQGSASNAYADLDTTFRGVAQTLADLDLQLAALVNNQCEFVTHMRLAFATLKQLLLIAYVIELTMFFGYPPLGPTAAQIFAVSAAVVGIGCAVSFLTTLLTLSILNAKKSEDLTSEYQKLATAVTCPATLLTPVGVAAAKESRVGRSAATSTSTSGTPAMAGAFGVASGLQARRTRLGALGSDGDTAGDGTPEVSKTTAAPSMPAFMMPTMGQLTAMSGHAGKLSGHLSQHSNLIDPPMAQQRRGVAGPAEQGADEATTEEATLAGGFGGAGATQTAERAPVEVTAAAAGQAKELHPLQRTG